MIALREALHALTREFQKLISKNEQIPTPSQPTKKTTKSEDVINIIINKVNKYIYDKNLN